MKKRVLLFLTAPVILLSFVQNFVSEAEKAIGEERLRAAYEFIGIARESGMDVRAVEVLFDEKTAEIAREAETLASEGRYEEAKSLYDKLYDDEVELYPGARDLSRRMQESMGLEKKEADPGDPGDPGELGEAVEAAVPAGPSARIHRVWTDFNVSREGQLGLLVHVDFSVEDMSGREGSVQAFFHFDNGEPLVDTNRQFYTASGNVALGEMFSPAGADVRFSDFQMFIPYSELHLPSGEHRLRYLTQVFDDNSRELATSDYYARFVITMP